MRTPKRAGANLSGLKSKHDSPQANAPESPDQLIKLERKFLKINKRLK